jgi:predicted SAM-dependent methyltransferase
MGLNITAKHIFKKIDTAYNVYAFRRKVNRSNGLRIIIGSGHIHYRGWLSTDIDILNLLEISDWQKYFKSRSIDAILAEHVWEHLTFSEASLGLKNCFKFLKPDGHLRIAVPDGYHPAPEYIEQVRPGGNGTGADDHKILFNYKILSELLGQQGFNVKLLEWFDENGIFHFEKWASEDGMVRRSVRFDHRNKNTTPLAYTSLIIDGYKPL